MYIRVPGCLVPFEYSERDAYESACAYRDMGATRDVAYGMLLGRVGAANEDCDLPDHLAIGALKNITTAAIDEAFG